MDLKPIVHRLSGLCYNVLLYKKLVASIVINISFII